MWGMQTSVPEKRAGSVSSDMSTALTVSLLDLKAQYAAIREEIREAIDRVCDSQRFVLGPEVAGFEEEVAEFCGVRFAVGVSSGTDALVAALMALGVGSDDEVITTPYSFFATAGAIVRLGARPIFVDIEPATFNLDATAVAAKITPRTKAILPVHLFGRCAEMDEILKAAVGHGISVVEDAAQAIGARDEKERSAGAIGEMGCFSFFPSKNLGGFGDGGMVVTNDEALAELLRMLRVHGGKPKYYHSIVGGNFRLDALQAAVLRLKLKHLPAWTQARRQNAQRYRALFEEMGLLKHVILPEDVSGHVYNQFVVRAAQRDRLREYLQERRVGTEVYYPLPLHRQKCFEPLGYKPGDFSFAEAAARETLALPIYPELSEDQQQYVVTQIFDFYSAAVSDSSYRPITELSRRRST